MLSGPGLASARLRCNSIIPQSRVTQYHRVPFYLMGRGGRGGDTWAVAASPGRRGRTHGKSVTRCRGEGQGDGPRELLKTGAALSWTVPSDFFRDSPWDLCFWRAALLRRQAQSSSSPGSRVSLQINWAPVKSPNAGRPPRHMRYLSGSVSKFGNSLNFATGFHPSTCLGQSPSCYSLRQHLGSLGKQQQRAGKLLWASLPRG